MRDELISEGLGDTVQFVIINQSGSAGSVNSLLSLCEFPVFQDTSEVNAWGLHTGKKDDMYVYDKEGNLAVFLPVSFSGSNNTNLGSADGYSYVKNAILDTLNTP